MSGFEPLREEIERQNRIHSQGYPRTRDGVRLALASIADELAEAEGCWRIERRNSWQAYPHTAEEVLQIAAICMRLLANIAAPSQNAEAGDERAIAIRMGLDPDAFPPGTLLRDLGRVP